MISKIPDWLKLVITVGVSNAAGLIGSVFTFSAIPTWYETLIKPELAPPNWIFGPVWTTLYVLMGVSAFLVWRKGIYRKGARVALGLFGVQLVLNALWSIVFFGMQNPAGAFFVLALLWVGIVATMIAFFKISRLATYLLVPYLLWVSFAGYLNYMIWVLN